jgi:hypothetical protein
MEQLSIHHDIETLKEMHYFKELNWKIHIPETNPEIREISLHNYSILKVLKTAYMGKMRSRCCFTIDLGPEIKGKRKIT